MGHEYGDAAQKNTKNKYRNHKDWQIKTIMQIAMRTLFTKL